MTINVIIGENYGFLNAKPVVPTFFDYMGPWPFYLITLQVIAYSLYAILLKIAPSAPLETTDTEACRLPQ